MENIKPCPFCGSDAKYYEISREYTKSDNRYFISCTNNECGAIIDMDSKSEVISAWNKREG